MLTHREVDLAPHPVVGLVLRVGDAENFLQALAFFSQKAGSMFHRHRGGWRWQETCKAWTCLHSWCCCTTRSCLVWPLLPLLGQYWCGFLLGKCHPCTGLLPNTWNWSPPLTETVHANICTDVVLAVGQDLALFCADLHSICCCSVYESVRSWSSSLLLPLR